MGHVLLTAALVLALLVPAPAAAQGQGARGQAAPEQRAQDQQGRTSWQVIDGRPAGPGEFPAMAAVVDRVGGQFCGGTLVDALWVVTAAHCLYDARTGGPGMPASELQIVLDTTDWRTGGERLDVDLIVLHPEYDDLRTVNDIAMLRLTDPAATPPAPIGEDPALLEPGRTAVVTGWGATDPYGQDPSPTLLAADVPLVDDADCAMDYELVPDRHVCAGDPGTEADPGPDTCQGDSGGPLWTDPGDGTLAIIGITSFGGLCGVDAPGVYTELRTYTGWVGGLVDGSIDPGQPVDPTTPELPSGADAPPLRIAADPDGPSDPVAQAVAISRQTFPDGVAGSAVIATAARFPDALSGSTLAYGTAPLLYTGPDGLLPPQVLQELRRVLVPGSPAFVLGGTAAIPAAVDQQLRDLGFQPRRLAGGGREETAATVARQVVVDHGGVLPLDTVVLATSATWPDAVAVGQIGAWWGTPILLTGTDGLHPAARQVLAELQPGRVLVVGGTAAVPDAVVAEVEGVTGAGTTERLAGPTRFGTAAAVADRHIELFHGMPPANIVVVNLRREPDGFAHVLAASMLAGAFAGVFAPVEGEGGDVLPPEVADALCGIDAPVTIAGGFDLVDDAAVSAVQAASAGNACDATEQIDLGDLLALPLTEGRPSRTATFDGTAGQQLRIRADSVDGMIDPFLELRDPDGSVLAANDDAREGVFNSRLDVTLPADGRYVIDVVSLTGEAGGVLLSVDPAPTFSHRARLTAQQPAVVVDADLPAGTRLIIELRRPPASAVDPVLAVLDAAGEEVAADDDGGGFPNARLELVTPGGPIEIRGRSFADETGPVEIAIAETAGPGDPGRYTVRAP